MDELQSNDEPVVEEQAEPTKEIAENPEEGSDLAPEKDSEGVQAAINKQHKKFRDEERKGQALSAQLAETQRQLQELQTQANKPDPIPDLPDQYDDDYETQIRNRDLAIQREAEYNANQRTLAQNQQAQQEQVRQQQQTEINETVATYDARAKDSGISAEELQEAGGVVHSYGISNELTMNILSDPDGPLITRYLAANPTEIDSLRNMGDLSAVLHIERNIRAKAVALKSKTSSAPTPATSISGGGAELDSAKYPHSKGATFE